jgi:hypothetical protein
VSGNAGDALNKHRDIYGHDQRVLRALKL